MIPRDVRTRWNSTYDMLYFSQNYRPAIDAITSEKSYKLRRYELDETEWDIIDRGPGICTRGLQESNPLFFERL
ncbi:hypothetical protein DFH07DRAFT_825557 [Mycena maculata]|uniref:Uncharacterized protein n=1 Tax=Mycena maculata TaxID=230809 RepID=A0AAD7IXD3_9AGAR|nr:hypothetical protein DFH07DRAFT_863959 [Mycena maculata]KAJ7752516.1 hypothetical protein DFH07DRAFT_825557 [Mycena maculata]